MEIMAGKINVGDNVVLRGCGKGFVKVTDVRFHSFPRNTAGKSYMMTIQSGPHHVSYNEIEMVKAR